MPQIVHFLTGRFFLNLYGEPLILRNRTVLLSTLVTPGSKVLSSAQNSVITHAEENVLYWPLATGPPVIFPNSCLAGQLPGQLSIIFLKSCSRASSRASYLISFRILGASSRSGQLLKASRVSGYIQPGRVLLKREGKVI